MEMVVMYYYVSNLWFNRDSVNTNASKSPPLQMPTKSSLQPLVSGIIPSPLCILMYNIGRLT